jgi:hypothetical protein
VSRAGEHLSDGRLIDLEAGLLDPDVRAQVLEHLRACAACEARLQDTHAAAERLTLRPVPRPEAASGRPDLSSQSRRRPRRIRPAVAVAMAAAILLVVAVPIVLRRPPADRLDVWLPVDENLLLTRSAASSEDSSFREAIAAYESRDSRRVVALLENRPIPPDRAPLQLLLGSALETEGRHARARAVIEALDVDTLPQPARDQARWVLFVSLRREGREPEARRLARELARGNSDFAGRARAALAEN